MKHLNNKKGNELSLQTIIIFIISVIVFVVIVYFFSTHYLEGTQGVSEVGTGFINNIKN